MRCVKPLPDSGRADSFPEECRPRARSLDAQTGTQSGASQMEMSMNRILMMAAFACAVGIACAAAGKEGRQESPIEVLGGKGLSAPAISVESSGAVTFVNGDESPHQIYSPDCPELASTALKPGQIHTVSLSAGPKVCHFQDLLAPLAPAWSGTAEVQKPTHLLADDFTAGGPCPRIPGRQRACAAASAAQRGHQDYRRGRARGRAALRLGGDGQRHRPAGEDGGLEVAEGNPVRCGDETGRDRSRALAGRDDPQLVVERGC